MSLNACPQWGSSLLGSGCRILGSRTCLPQNNFPAVGQSLPLKGFRALNSPLALQAYFIPIWLHQHFFILIRSLQFSDLLRLTPDCTVHSDPIPISWSIFSISENLASRSGRSTPSKHGPRQAAPAMLFPTSCNVSMSKNNTLFFL